VEKERKQKRRTFSAEYKAETVPLIERSGKSIGQMALELGDWRHRAAALGGAGGDRSGTGTRRSAKAHRAGRVGGAAA
jgi:transposase-like protein